MARVSRSSVLTLVVVLALLAALPGSIYRVIQTRDLYLFSRHFFADILARLSGPGRLRFIIQPSMAILLGARDGAKDARAGARPFFAAHRGHRRQLLRDTFASIRDLIAIAILLDMISQLLIFRGVRVGAALVVGPVLIALPYALSRALSNRITRWRNRRRNTRHPQLRRAA
jgi:hypothetical protein